MEILNIWFDDKNIFLKTKQGDEKSMPLKWFPRLEKATEQQRKNLNSLPLEFIGKKSKIIYDIVIARKLVALQATNLISTH
jgi:hypothetical protein